MLQKNESQVSSSELKERTARVTEVELVNNTAATKNPRQRKK